MMVYSCVTGEFIPVRVGDRKFVTVIDAHGVQRFKENTAVRAFVRAATASSEAWMDVRRPEGFPAPFDLNSLIVEYFEGKHSLDDMLTFYTSIGYSVSGFMDISIFDELEVRNPLWEQAHYQSLSGKVLDELMVFCQIPYEHSGNVSTRAFHDAVMREEWTTSREKPGHWVSGTRTVTDVVNRFLRSQNVDLYEIDFSSASKKLKAFVENLKENS